jgi:hypothetical protein
LGRERVAWPTSARIANVRGGTGDQWAKGVPFEAGEEYGEEALVEIRPIFELDEFAQAYGDSPVVRRVVELEKGLQQKK